MTFSLGLFSHYPIAASVLILLLIIGIVISSYLASQRLKKQKARLAGVLVANTVAALAVVGLAFDIQIFNEQASVAYLVTNGVTIEQLEQVDTQQPLFVMNEASKSKAFRAMTDSNILDDAIPIDVPSQILSYRGSFDNLHVIGDGLSSTQWQDLQRLMGETFPNISVTFSGSKPRIGLVDMSWPRELAVGQFVEIKGQLQGTDSFASTNTIYRLNLLDPVGQIVQTIRLKPSERFTLSFPAKVTGRWIYRLQLSKPDDINLLADEPVAFLVAKPAPLRILIKQSTPSFETRQLKNWASKFGSQISVLTQISQDKAIRQNINLSAAQLQQITSPFTDQTLGNIDWLLIDGRALLKLTVQQMTTLQTAIEEGLGVYIIADKTLVNAWPVPSLDWLLGVNIRPLNVANYAAIPRWPYSKIEQAMPVVKATITSNNGASLVQNNNDQILVSRSKIGLGQVAVSLINATYGWQTSGLTQQYSHYWQSVIYTLARPKQTPHWLNAEHNTLSRLNQRVQRCLLGAANTGTAVTIHNHNPQPLILSQDLLQTRQNCLTVWPKNEGWHQLAWSKNTELSNTKNERFRLTETGSVETWLYAYAEENWQVWRQLQNTIASQEMAKQQNTINTINTRKIQKTSLKSLDKVWLWGGLILFMSLLWLERKLF